MDYKTLPEHFLSNMKILLGEEYDIYLKSFKEEAHHGLRVNSLKISPKDFGELVTWNLEQVPWISKGFYYDGDLKPARHPWYYAGLYYLQEPSAMTPADILPIVPGDCVLDLCAAPGGKSTELAAKLEGQGLLFSNDISSSRAKALLKNLELFGVENVLVASESPDKLVDYFPEFFDKILVDAPCSGEGMFRRDEGLIKSFLEKGPEYYSPIQKSVTEQAVKLLKPGGMLLYSTCTFDEEENEGTIRYILEQYPDMKLVNIEKKAGFEPGHGLPECVRLFPHKIGGEGHFMALLQKEAGTAVRQSGNVFKSNLSRQEREAIEGFLRLINRNFESERLYIKNDCIYYLPKPLTSESPEKLSKIRYLRTGLFLGELKKGRFEPSQALAMALHKEDFFDITDFSSEDERVIRYLKGETISLKEEEIKEGNGWCLICVDGFPLGFAKRTGASLKNKYYPGWRWQ